MSKKQKNNKFTATKNTWLVNPQQIKLWLDQTTSQLMQKDYQGAVLTCQRILRTAPPKTKIRGEALRYLGLAHGMLDNHEASYTALLEAVEIEPREAELWYNLGLAARFTARFGHSLRDFERAMQLEIPAPFIPKFKEALKFSRELVEQSLALRGADFTLDQLIEQEELFQQGIKELEKEKWEVAEQIFRHVIAIRDCLPQPWFNLGMALIMQKHYDEGETALKRALELDPEYETARHNLALLPQIRRDGGVTGPTAMRDPFREVGLKKSLTMYKEG